MSAKGGCAKSLTAREILAAPIRKSALVIEIDELNRQQKDFRNSFLDVVEITPNHIENVITYLKKYEDVVIDVGVENLSRVFLSMLETKIFNHLDNVVIPVLPGRYEAEGAFQVFDNLKKCNVQTRVVFALNMVDPTGSVELERQHFGFFRLLESRGLTPADVNVVRIPYSTVFTEALYRTRTVVELAGEPSLINDLLEEDSYNGFTERAAKLANAEWNRLAAKDLVENWIYPAHDFIRGEI